MEKRNQLLIVTANSFWNTTNFIFTGVFGFIFSIILTRYLGPESYGKYSYIFSIVAVLTLAFELGSSQTIGKYVPKFFHDDQNRAISLRFYKVFSATQFLLSSIFVFIFYLTKSLWIDRLDLGWISNGLIIALLAYIPLMCLASTFINFVGATQNYKKISISYSIVYVLNLILLLSAAYWKLSLEYFIFINIMTNAAVGLVVYFFAKDLLRPSPKPKKKVDTREVLRFSGLAYVNLFMVYIVWSYSEIFFLKKYSSIENVGYYALAFGISTIFFGLVSTAQKSVYNAQFELLEDGQEEKADMMTYLAIKYSALIFLPIVIFSSLIMTNAVEIVYGTKYLSVALIFPYIIISRSIVSIFNPITIKANNNNFFFARIVAITAMGAVINLLADYLLIPRYQLLGAGYANFIGQTITVILITTYVLNNIKFHFKIHKVISIIIINIGLAILTLMFYRLHLNIWYNLLYCIVTSILYLKVLKNLKQFEIIEYRLITTLAHSLPESFQNFLRIGYGLYKKI